MRPERPKTRCREIHQPKLCELGADAPTAITAEHRFAVGCHATVPEAVTAIGSYRRRSAAGVHTEQPPALIGGEEQLIVERPRADDADADIANRRRRAGRERIRLYFVVREKPDRAAIR